MGALGHCLCLPGNGELLCWLTRVAFPIPIEDAHSLPALPMPSAVDQAQHQIRDIAIAQPNLDAEVLMEVQNQMLR